ncbi:MAG: DUF2723 domain-containing protein [Acidobacteria bacterium]|nr:DUF2723 domain-containing protein [Acidobacteriota bacterium]
MAATLLFVGAHLPFVTPVTGDLDSVNFVLGVREFDVARHQPHPPGYPVLVALGKAGAAIAVRINGGAGGVTSDMAARVLAVCGVLFGALGVVPLFVFFRALESSERRAWAAVVLTATSPLYWFTSIRALSDVPGLAAACVSLALLAVAMRRQRDISATDPGESESSARERRREATAQSGRLIVLGALVAGLSLGLRSQTGWMTVPTLALVLLHRAGRGAAGALLGAVMTFTIGVLAWAVPLVMTSGGPGRYLSIVASQAGEDLAGVYLLATDPTPRHAAFSLIDTFIRPWPSIPLASLVIVLGAVGLFVMLVKAPTALMTIMTASLPYAAFHLFFHETATTRYALPLVPATAYLAARALDALGRRALAMGTAALATVFLVTAVPAVALYARGGSPLSSALADIAARAGRTAPRPVLAMHHAVALSSRDRTLPLPVLPSVPKREWLEVVRYLRGNAPQPVWYLTEADRTDAAMIDHAGRRLVRVYGWPVDAETFVGGARPDEIAWYEIHDPGWLAATGWSLTPEIAGTRRGAENVAIAYVRSRADPAFLMIGGRNLAPPGSGSARVTVAVDGRPLEAWEAAPGFFVKTFEWPAGALESPARLARLEITSAPMVGTDPVDVAIEQFDLQAPRSVVFAFGPGWHEQEYNPTAGRLWRWTSERADAIVHHGGHDLILRMTAESPLRYFDAPPRVVVRAGQQVLARAAPDADFSWRIRVPAEALDRAGGILTVQTDRVFVPSDRSASSDRRHLGLRIYGFDLTPAS